MDCSPPGSCPWDFPGKNTGAGCHFLLQGIFPNQGWNSCLLHCRWILYHWATGECMSGPMQFKAIVEMSTGVICSGLFIEMLIMSSWLVVFRSSITWWIFFVFVLHNLIVTFRISNCWWIYLLLPLVMSIITLCIWKHSLLGLQIYGSTNNVMSFWWITKLKY